MVYLGIEFGFKVYRLFDSETKRIKISRDVVFDEDKSWNWSNFILMNDDYDEGFEIEIRGVSEKREFEGTQV